MSRPCSSRGRVRNGPITRRFDAIDRRKRGVPTTTRDLERGRRRPADRHMAGRPNGLRSSSSGRLHDIPVASVTNPPIPLPRTLSSPTQRLPPTLHSRTSHFLCVSHNIPRPRPLTLAACIETTSGPYEAMSRGAACPHAIHLVWVAFAMCHRGNRQGTRSLSSSPGVHMAHTRNRHGSWREGGWVGCYGRYARDETLRKKRDSTLPY